MAKARNYDRGFPQFIFDFFWQFQEKGPNYIDALLQGYVDPPPADFTLPEGSYYNKYFPGHAIKMPKPISDDQVTYEDGTPQKLLDVSKLAEAGWTARVPLETGLRSTIDWFHAHERNIRE